MRNIYLDIAKMVQPPSDLVLATVTGNEGSAPQKPGSSALFRGSSLVSGTVGGGTVENSISEYAGLNTSSKLSAWLHFKLDNDVSMKYEAICGGTISILADADPLKHLPVFREMQKSLEDGTPGMLATILTPSEESHITIHRYWISGSPADNIPDFLTDHIRTLSGEIPASGVVSGFKQFELTLPGEQKSSSLLLEPVFPLPRLVIAGAGHIGKALSHLGRMLDFEVIVTDDRHEYANPYNLPDADHIIVKNTGDALREIRKDRSTYIVIVTRGHKDDAEALKACIDSEAGYIGMIGSRSKVAKMRDDFIANELATVESWDRIFTPIGLKIGSKTVEEIAVSIAAQLVEVRNRK